MRAQKIRPALFSLLTPALLTCTNASVYGVLGNGPQAADRVLFTGTACAPQSTGATFPVKVLFDLEGGAPQVSTDDTMALVAALNDIANRSTVETVSYALVAFHTVGNALAGTFTDPTTFQAAVQQFPSFQESGPVSLSQGLELTQNVLDGDMANSCRGTLARTRYVVVVAFTSPDETCSNPVYNGLIDPSGCGGDGGVAGDVCVACRLTYDVQAIQALGAKYNVGEIDILPVYFRDLATPDPVAQAAALAIAKAAGSQALVTDQTALKNDLERLNYGSLAAPLVLKRLYAWNRNSLPRGGQLYVDSDGDGLSDIDERAIYKTDPLKYDTDGDGLGDGVEVKVGLNPLVADVLHGCDPTQDADGDRLNDCEEQVLGTDSCQSDTDGDGFSDLVETLSGTNPLVAENTSDNDRDGFLNTDELVAHTDPNSNDIAFRRDHAYDFSLLDGGMTNDGRNCFVFQINNVGLVATASVPNPPFPDTPAGNNDLYLYLELGFQGRLLGEVSSLYVQQVVYDPPNRQSPPSPDVITPDVFVLGQ